MLFQIHILLLNKLPHKHLNHILLSIY